MMSRIEEIGLFLIREVEFLIREIITDKGEGGGESRGLCKQKTASVCDSEDVCLFTFARG